MSSSLEVRVTDALIPGALNAVINGAIAYATAFSGAATVPLTLDLVSSKQHTVWGQGVVLAFALGIILSLITAFSFRKRIAQAGPEVARRLERPMFPSVLGIALGNGMALFGWFVAIAVLWQRFLGTIEVGPIVAAVLVGLLAGIVTVVVETRTKHALLRPV